jgi:hypothetical protein
MDSRMWRNIDSPRVALLIWLVLLMPPLRAGLESSMALHMLVQLPLLALVGLAWGRAWAAAPTISRRGRVLAWLQTFNRGGATGLVLVSFTMLLWMLPRWLDAARLDMTVDIVKFLSVPLAFGAALAISWPRCPPIARAVIHLEGIATLLRFGWGYLAADQRLCLVYLLEDQQRVGVLLLWLAAAWALTVIWRPLFGSLPVLRGKSASRSSVRAR